MQNAEGFLYNQDQADNSTLQAELMDEEETQALTPAQKRLESLEKKKKELEKRIREEQRLIKKAERNRHTLRLISMGLLVATEIKNGARTEEEVREKLDKILTQESHRLAWGLEPLPKPKKQGKGQPKQAETPDTTSQQKPPQKTPSTDTRKPKQSTAPATSAEDKPKLKEAKKPDMLKEFEV